VLRNAAQVRRTNDCYKTRLRNDNNNNSKIIPTDPAADFRFPLTIGMRGPSCSFQQTQCQMMSRIHDRVPVRGAHKYRERFVHCIMMGTPGSRLWRIACGSRHNGKLSAGN